MPQLSAAHPTSRVAVLAALLLVGCAGTRPVATRESAGDADAQVRQGIEALRARDAVAAERALSACVQSHPERADCRWELGWSYWLQGRWAEVVAAWEEVARIDPHRAGLAEKLAEARALLARQEHAAKPTAAAVTPADPRPGAGLRLRAVGDVMLGTDFPEGFLPPNDGAHVLEAVRELLADADLTFVNLEGPLCDHGSTKKCRRGSNCYAFRCPTRYGRYLRDAGVDLASTANNHSGDFGEECRRETEATLDSLGIAWSGPPGSIARVEKNGVRVALVAFHASASCNYLNDIAAAQALVRQAAEGSDLVVVSFHGGAEGIDATHVKHGPELFYKEDRGDLRTFAHAVVDAGAAVVIGHGPHVVRAMEVYRDRLVAYSLGNFATYGRFSLQGPLALGMVLEVRLARDGRFAGGRIFSTRQLGEGIPVPDPDGRAADLVRRLTAEDFPDSGVQVALDGTILLHDGTAPNPAEEPAVAAARGEAGPAPMPGR